MAATKPTTQSTFLQPSPRRAGVASAYVLWWLSDSIDFEGECWAWTGHATERGYGMIDLKNYAVPRSIVLVHRLVYEICVAPIPDGLCVLHHCDNPPCCRPDHLFLGTDQDNADDKVAKGRQATGQDVRANHDHLKGETVKTSHLTGLDVLEIRRREAAGEHPKVIALDFASGGKYTIEGSSNLSGNGSGREQFALINHPVLHSWHAQWIDEWARKFEGKEDDDGGE